MRVPKIQELRVECSYQCTAAEKWRSKPNSFLLGEAYDLDAEGKAPASQRFEQRHRQNHPENAVESSGVGHRIEVGSHEDSRPSGFGSVESAQIPGGIYSHVGSRGFQPTAD